MGVSVSVPTDRLYKLKAVGGLLLVAVATCLFLLELRAFETVNNAVGEQIAALEADTAFLEKDYSQASPDSIAAVTLEERRRTLARQIAVLREKHGNLRRRIDQDAVLILVCAAMVAVGTYVSMQGFSVWSRRED